MKVQHHRVPGCLMSALSLSLSLSLALALHPAARAAEPGDHGLAAADAAAHAVASWAAVDAATGYETRTVGRLAEAMPGWNMDRWGNLWRSTGSGSPHRVLACGLDAPAYVASQLRDDGYLRVHRIGRGSTHPLWDQQHEAKPLRVLTRSGPVTGVAARSNGHFASQHRAETRLVTADQVWVDVGAENAADLARLGIALLDPVVRQLPSWVLAGGQVAGPAVGKRSGCAVVAALGTTEPLEAAEGRTSFLMSANSGLGWIGLASAVTHMPAVDELLVLAGGAVQAVDEQRSAEDLGRLGSALMDAGLAALRWIEPRVGNSGAHLEWIEPSEVQRAASLAARFTGRDSDSFQWTRAPARAALSAPARNERHSRVADTLETLVDLYGVSAHEWSVRRALLEAMPAWARERATVDGIGNVTVELGPPGRADVFMAHLDEVGYEVTAIDADGTVSLRRMGGALHSAWEGETALLHFDPPGAPSTAGGDPTDLDPRWKDQSLRAQAPAPLRGLFAQRADPATRHPEALSAWFGVDGAGLRQLGARPGMQVTMYKEGLPLGSHRLVARGLDDRAGSTALLLALQQIDPQALKNRLIFAWSVHEEGGLLGAAAMASRFGKSSRRIYSIDTFVSSDTPLESPHFAFAPLGSGPVLRAAENTGVSPDAERDRVLRVAAEAGIPLQLGLTQGGTDGTTFSYRGAPNQGLSWPGRYSHSPGEVLDLRDLAALVDLIGALARSED